MSNYVFLIDAKKTPMNPIHPSHARKLLNSGKAAVFRQYPFTLILKREVKDIVAHPLQVKIDPGSKVTGFALVTDQEEVIWGMELTHRGQSIKSNLDSRRAVRRNRRSKIRHRKARFLNRKREEGWLTPSLEHRVLTVETWLIKFIRFIPIKEVVIEQVRFDMQRMQNPNISNEEYQQGTLHGFRVREYLLEKWGRECAYCGKRDAPLQVEHIHPKSKGGSNRISNLCLACEKCNKKKGDKPIEQFLKKKPSLLSKIKSQAKKPLKDAAAVNATRKAIVKMANNRCIFTDIPVTTGEGAQTKYNRCRLNLNKEHWLDAACIGVVDKLKVLTTKILKVKATGFGGRQKYQTDRLGYPVKYRPLKPIHGYCTGDVVKVFIPKGVNKGSYIARLCPYTSGNGEIYPKTGKKRIGIKLDYIVKPVHRKDGYSYV